MTGHFNLYKTSKDYEWPTAFDFLLHKRLPEIIYFFPNSKYRRHWRRLNIRKCFKEKIIKVKKRDQHLRIKAEETVLQRLVTEF